MGFIASTRKTGDVLSKQENEREWERRSARAFKKRPSTTRHFALHMGKREREREHCNRSYVEIQMSEVKRQSVKYKIVSLFH